IDGLLVIAPKGVYSSWLYDHIPKHLPDRVLGVSRVFLWRANWRTKAFQEECSKVLQRPEGDFHVLVMKPEALNTEYEPKDCARFLKNHRTLMVVDESTIIKNHKAKWTKQAIRLSRYAAYRRIMTGTPITNSPMDAYSQFDFLDPSILGHSS